MNPGDELVLPSEMSPLRARSASEMTMREYAAIHLRQPISEVPWLDDAIRATRREAIALAMSDRYLNSKDVIGDADRLIAKLEGE